MATTAVFAEILIVGLQVEAWLLLAVLAVSGNEWIDGIDDGGFAGVLVVAVLAVAYVLGIVVDRLADTLLDWFEGTGVGERIKGWVSQNQELAEEPSISTMRMTVMHESEGMTRFLDYQRSRWRIVRATVFNLALGALAAAIYLAVREDAAWYWWLAPPAAALVLIPIAYFAGVRIQDAWVNRLSDAYSIVSRPRI